jgi:hypothetical protein
MTRGGSKAWRGWRRFWPALALAPLLALVAWPARSGAVVSGDPALAVLRVAYPQVEVLEPRRFEALRRRALVVDAVAASPRTAAELAERLGPRSEGRAIVFRAPRADAALALRAALQARVWGFEPCCAYLD